MRHLKLILPAGLLFLFSSCNRPADNIKREYYKDGTLKSEILPVKDSLNQFTFIEFYPTGFLKSIQALKNDTTSGQLLSFHKNGYLDKKIIVDTNGASGMAYWFYPNGTMSNIRRYKNDKEIGIGGDYWNKPYGIIQSTVFFNDSAKILYKINYDSSGNFINSEGKRPSYWKGD